MKCRDRQASRTVSILWGFVTPATVIWVHEAETQRQEMPRACWPRTCGTGKDGFKVATRMPCSACCSRPTQAMAREKDESDEADAEQLQNKK